MIKIIKEPKYDGYELKCKKCKTKFRIKFDDTYRSDFNSYCYCPKCNSYISIFLWSKKIFQKDWSTAI